MGDWWKRFFAVDNSINEQSVIGVFWGAVALIMFALKIAGVSSVETELIYMALGSSLLCFGISGFKRV